MQARGTSQAHYAECQSPERKKVYPVWFHSHETLENETRSAETERSVVARERREEKEWGVTTNEYVFLWGLMKTSWNQRQWLHNPIDMLETTG